MAKLTGAELVAAHCKALSWPGSGAYLTQALFTLNEAQKTIDQLGSMSYLKVDTTLSLGAAVDYVELGGGNPVVDIGKQATLRHPGTRKGALTFLDADKWLVSPMDEYGAWNIDRPAYWTWSTTVAGAVRILFDRANGSGGALVYPFTYQRVSAAIANDGGTSSSLQEGYEVTLLLPLAELIEKRKLGRAGWRDLHTKLYGGDEKTIGGSLGRFLDQFGARKEEPRPDREQLERAQSTTLSEGT